MNKPNAVSELQTIGLEKVLDEFPYFQSARALRLKGLYNQNSFKYNFAFKSYTNTSILFDFITSDSFNAIQKTFFEKKETNYIYCNCHEISIQKKSKAPPLH
jgi:hypothetical protein